MSQKLNLGPVANHLPSIPHTPLGKAGDGTQHGEKCGTQYSGFCSPVYALAYVQLPICSRTIEDTVLLLTGTKILLVNSKLHRDWRMGSDELKQTDNNQFASDGESGPC